MMLRSLKMDSVPYRQHKGTKANAFWSITVRRLRKRQASAEETLRKA